MHCTVAAVHCIACIGRLDNYSMEFSWIKDWKIQMWKPKSASVRSIVSKIDTIELISRHNGKILFRSMIFSNRTASTVNWLNSGRSRYASAGSRRRPLSARLKNTSAQVEVIKDPDKLRLPQTPATLPHPSSDNLYLYATAVSAKRKGKGKARLLHSVRRTRCMLEAIHLGA